MGTEASNSKDFHASSVASFLPEKNMLDNGDIFRSSRKVQELRDTFLDVLPEEIPGLPRRRPNSSTTYSQRFAKVICAAASAAIATGPETAPAVATAAALAIPNAAFDTAAAPADLQLRICRVSLDGDSFYPGCRLHGHSFTHLEAAGVGDEEDEEVLNREGGSRSTPFDHSNCSAQLHNSCACVTYIAEHTKAREEATKVCVQYELLSQEVTVPEKETLLSRMIRLRSTPVAHLAPSEHSNVAYECTTSLVYSIASLLIIIISGERRLEICCNGA
jgi:hypothetical protein